jgi:tRNA dimethylallyltransferase
VTSSDPAPLFALVGVTASGKTDVAALVAERRGAEVLSLDSMLVYCGLDVGTAKPDAALRERVPHRLIDLVEPDVRYDVQRYLADAAAAETAAAGAGLGALFAGGTGFYLKALTHGLFEGPEIDPALRARLEARADELGSEALHTELAAVDTVAAERIHPRDARRVVRALEVLEQTGRTLTSWQEQWRAEGGDTPGRPRTLVGLEPDPEELEERIPARTRAMLDAGWVEEAVRVREAPGFGPTAIQALGYREVLRHADGELTEAELFELVALRTRQFARRQRTWFRNFPEIRWVPGPGRARSVEETAEAVVAEFGWSDGTP